MANLVRQWVKVCFAFDARAETTIPYATARTSLVRSAGRMLMPAG
jgi:hypothetical protein